MLTSASNFTISGNARLYEIHGNAVINHLADTDEQKLRIQAIVSLPRAQASQKDYETRKKSGPCFPGTRKALLQEVMDWVAEAGESRMYVLSGLAGIGKSTVVYTLATQADEIGLLGASFFFSRDDADRNNAKKFFSTIAYQLCLYNEAFANAIGEVLLTERGSAAFTQDPQKQLEILLLDPLRSIVQSCARPTLVVVDALDECDEVDQHAVVMGLTQLVRLLSSFKVILTTRPQPLVDHLFANRDGHNIFHLEDIEGKVIDGDIRLYLSHSFSQKQVRARLQNPKEDWCASDKDIDSLVKAAGRLFIVASTSVLYVLNRTLGNPATQMKKLLGGIAQDRTPFHALNHFYSVIVRSAIQVDDDVGDTVDRYQNIIGAIVVIQTPLPVTTLAYLIGEEAKTIYGMLRNFQSVILLGGDDAPRMYHKSFPDYLTDATRCKDPHLRIDPRILHTQIATRCFEVMDKHLKYNILGLGNPARFMRNEDGLKEDGITNERLEERIPQQLRYACVYWVNHLEAANIEDIDLMNGLERFVYNHMLHWFEVLSLIGKLDLAHRVIGVVIKLVGQFSFIRYLKRLAYEVLQKPASSNLDQLLSDALRFICQFYEIIERSALHTYYSALPFAPTKSLLYRQYIKEAIHNICVIKDGPEEWNAFVACLNTIYIGVMKFSLDSFLFVSWFDSDYLQGRLKIWDATTGTPISVIPGRRFAIANDFSTIASSENSIISYYNVNGSARGAMFTALSTIKHLALSSETNRIAAGLDDGTVLLWDSINSELIGSFNDIDIEGDKSSCLQFSSTGTRLAYLSSISGIVKLRDGISGRSIADLQCGSLRRFEFSADGSRMASVSYDNLYSHLRLWNSDSGALIDDAEMGFNWTISANGSLLATTGYVDVTLWSENHGHLAKIEVLQLPSPSSMTFSVDNVLAIATKSAIKLYDVKTRSFISALPFNGSCAGLAFSPDCTRLAIANYFNGGVYLCDIGRKVTSSSLLNEKPKAITALALSRDCSRLARGFEDGTIELLKTGSILTKQRIGFLNLHPKLKAILPIFGHEESVTILAISPDGKLLASGSNGRTIKLWNCKDGLLRGTFNVDGRLQSVALSNSVLVAGWDIVDNGVTMWNLDTLRPIHTFRLPESVSTMSLSIADNSALIAIADDLNSHISLLEIVNNTIIAEFNVPHTTHTTMTFLPDNSHLVLRSDEGTILSINLIDKHIVEGPTPKHLIQLPTTPFWHGVQSDMYIVEGPTLEHLIQLPTTPFWHGVPIWHCKDKGQHYILALFPQNKYPVPVLWIPNHIYVEAWTQGSSMIALGCLDGRVIILRPPSNSHVG